MTSFGTVTVTKEMPCTDWLRVPFLSPMAMCVRSEYPNRIRALLAKMQGGIDAEWATNSTHYIHFLDFPAGCSSLCALLFLKLPLKCLSFKIILFSVLFYTDYTFSVSHHFLIFDYYL